MKHHIVIDARLQETGIGRYAHELVVALGRLDKTNRYTIICKNRSYFGPVPKDWQFLEVAIPHYSLAEQIQLPRLLGRLKADLVHFTHFNSPIFYPRARVVTIHDLTLHFYPGNRMRTNPLRNGAYRLVMQQAARRADAILVPSESTKRDVRRILHIPTQRIAVTPEGVDAAFSEVATRAKSTAQGVIKARLGIEPPFILYVGVWSEHKNIERLIEAFEMLRDSATLNPRLVIAGKSNPRYPALGVRIQSSRYRKEILTPGFIPDKLLPTLYRAADVFCFVSLYEGFGLPVIEAQAAGTPVVAANTTSLPEAGGDAAFYVNPYHVPEITHALKHALAGGPGLEKRLNAGRAHAKQFSWDKMAQQTLTIYEHILRRSR